MSNLLSRSTEITILALLVLLLIPVVAVHSRGVTHIVSARDLIEYTDPELTELPESLQNARAVRVRTLIFHDWTYPEWDRIEAVQENPQRWIRYSSDPAKGRDYEFHGLKFRLDPFGLYDDLHNSGPKMIAFLSVNARANIEQMKRRYVSGKAVTAVVRYIGVLKEEVWDYPVQVREDDMHAFEVIALRFGPIAQFY